MTHNVAASVVRTGISGWRYAPWCGSLYPKGLPQRQELAFAASRLRTIEINGTFYALQQPSSCAAWAADAPDGFVFAVKGPRFVTHMKKLRDVTVPMANFFASGVLALGSKSGPMLWQLPPQLRFDGRIEEFLAALPRSTAELATLAQGHDARVDGRAASPNGATDGKSSSTSTTTSGRAPFDAQTLARRLGKPELPAAPHPVRVTA